MSELKTTSLSHKDNNTGTPNITMYPDGTTSLNYAATGFKNQLINADFRVWQRGEDLSITGSQVKYGPDRWFFRANSSVGASSTEAKLVQDGPISKCRIVYNGTPTGPGYIQQRIETQNIQGLYGKELTFSFYLENVSMSTAPVPTVAVTAYGSGGSATQLVDSNNPITSLGNNRYSVTYTYTTSDGTVNDATGFGMSISVFINGQSTVAANACQFWNAQLEVGPVASPMEQRPIGTELALCQRYYEEYSSPSNATVIFRGIAMAPTAGASGNLATSSTLKFATPKRVSPTVTVYGYDVGSGFPANEVHRQDTTGGTNAPVDSYETSETGVDIVVTGCAPTVYYNILVFSYNADAEL